MTGQPFMPSTGYSARTFAGNRARPAPAKYQLSEPGQPLPQRTHAALASELVMRKHNGPQKVNALRAALHHGLVGVHLGVRFKLMWSNLHVFPPKGA